MKKLGLVFAGGGGRGAYQIGVWKALRETGLDNYITSVSGTSVGGLNAALFLQNDLDKAQSVWDSISMRKILTPKFDSNQGFSRLSLFERDGLKKIIDENLDMGCFDNSEYNCWMTCLNEDKHPSQSEYEEVYALPDGTKGVRKYVDGPREYFNMKFYDDEQRKQILLATSAMQFIFPKEGIDGQKFGDGGADFLGGDNVPVKPVYEIDKCSPILIVHLRNMGKLVDRDKFPNAALFEIFPKEDLGGTFSFTAEEARGKIRQGYEDTYALFQQISENIRSHQCTMERLADEYEKELQYSIVKKQLQCKNIELMDEIQWMESGE